MNKVTRSIKRYVALSLLLVALASALGIERNAPAAERAAKAAMADAVTAETWNA